MLHLRSLHPASSHSPTGDCKSESRDCIVFEDVWYMCGTSSPEATLPRSAEFEPEGTVSTETGGFVEAVSEDPVAPKLLFQSAASDCKLRVNATLGDCEGLIDHDDMPALPVQALEPPVATYATEASSACATVGGGYEMPTLLAQNRLHYEDVRTGTFNFLATMTHGGSSGSLGDHELRPMEYDAEQVEVPTDWEIEVFDDASCCNTPDILTEMAAAAPATAVVKEVIAGVAANENWTAQKCLRCGGSFQNPVALKRHLCHHNLKATPWVSKRLTYNNIWLPRDSSGKFISRRRSKSKGSIVIHARNKDPEPAKTFKSHLIVGRSRICRTPLASYAVFGAETEAKVHRIHGDNNALPVRCAASAIFVCSDSSWICSCDGKFSDIPSWIEHLAFRRCSAWSSKMPTSKSLPQESSRSASQMVMCGLCHQSIKSNFRLRQHLRVHIAEAVSCLVCKRLFSKQCDLDKHMIRHKKPEGGAPSELPTAVAPVLAGMTPHNYQRCPICKRPFARLSDLKRHASLHPQPKAVSPEHPCLAHTVTQLCDMCGQLFGDVESLNHHLRCHQARSAERYQPLSPTEPSRSECHSALCHLCGQQFSSMSLLDQHVYVTHVEKEDDGLPSAVCKMAGSPVACSSAERKPGLPVTPLVAKLSSLQREGLPEQAKSNACKTCFWHFSSRSSLQKHEQVHVKESLTEFKPNPHSTSPVHSKSALMKDTVKTTGGSSQFPADGLLWPALPRKFGERKKVEAALIKSDGDKRGGQKDQQLSREWSRSLADSAGSHHGSASSPALPDAKRAGRPMLFSQIETGSADSTTDEPAGGNEDTRKRSPAESAGVLDRPQGCGYKSTVAYFTGGKDSWRCSLCQMTFTKRDRLPLHMATHGRKPLECKLCNKSYMYDSVFQFHSDVHAGKARLSQASLTVPPTCEMCLRKFASEENVREHMVRVHGETGDHSCGKCGDVFHLLHSLQKHRRRRH